MKTITCVYTGMGGLVEKIEGLFKEAVPGARFHHILDSGLIADVVAANGVTPILRDRLFALYDAAATTGADVIVSTCSSIGDVTREYAELHPETNMLSIDYPMAKYAAENGKKVVVMATLSTTVEPSAKLVAQLAKECGRSVEIVPVTVEGAFQAMISGDMKAAADLVLASAKENCADADTVLLAQASMGFFKEALADLLGDKVTLLESPSTCAAYLKENL